MMTLTLREPRDPRLARLDKLYSGVVADVLDAMGLRSQSLPAELRPLTPSLRVSGRIFTARGHSVSTIPEKPYELEIGAVDAMQPDDVLVVDVGGDRSCAFWGELLTTACLAKGVRGVVMNACTRDVWRLRELPFPVFGIGYHPADSLGRVDIVELGGTVTLGGVEMRPGDLLLGDEDGLVAVPQQVADEALRRAEDKVAGENLVRADLLAGVPVGEVFRKYGFL